MSGEGGGWKVGWMWVGVGVGVGMGGRRVCGGGGGGGGGGQARAGAVEVAEDAGRLGREAFSKAFGN